MNSTLAPAAEQFHIAFYKFAKLADADAVVTVCRELTHDLLGSILIADEGINGVLAGEAAALDHFEHALKTDPRLDGAFSNIVFKRSACKTAPFARMKVHRKSEIVFLGVDNVDAISRNSFEYKLGKFKNAVDPGVDNFRDFPKYIEEHVPEWQASGKRVAMYCTGGIRCEKTSAWMLDMGVPVYQLEGGILNYFLEMPDAEKDWEGECFVFDNRIALDTKMQETDTTLEDVYGGEPDWEWRLQRAKRLDADSE
jgi:UPF0176 protein